MFMYHYFTGLDLQWCGSTPRESIWIVKYLTRINSSLSSHFKNEERSCIIISRVLTCGGADWLRAHRFKSLSTSHESTQVCSHVLRTRNVYVSLFHGSWLPVMRIDSVKIESNRQVGSWVYWTWIPMVGYYWCNVIKHIKNGSATSWMYARLTLYIHVYNPAELEKVLRQ